MLFIDYSSAFNTIVLSKPVIKLETLGLDTALCISVLDFDGPPPGGEGRKQHLPADPQQRSPTRVLSQPSPVLPVQP